MSGEDAPFVALIGLLLAIPAMALVVAFYALLYLGRGLKWLLVRTLNVLAYQSARRDVNAEFDAAERRLNRLR